MSFISRAMCYLVLGLNWANLLEYFVIIMLPGVPELLLGLCEMVSLFSLGIVKMYKENHWGWENLLYYSESTAACFCGSVSQG